MDKDIHSQLVIYSILANFNSFAKINKALEGALSTELRKELEARISALEEEKKELLSTMESMRKVKETHEEELKNLRSRNKALQKENKELENKNEETLSELNLLRSQLASESSE